MRPAIALVAAVAVALAACGPSPSAPQTSQPGASPADLVTLPPATAGPPTNVPAIAVPSVEPPPTAEPTIEPSTGPGASLEPTVDSIKVKRYADCAADNGTSTVGYVKISWTASGTTGVRISIDPPSPGEAYGYGYDDYPANGSAEVPFACDPPNHDAAGDYHLYVITTLHTKGTYFYRYARVYQIVVESPAP